MVQAASRRLDAFRNRLLATPNPWPSRGTRATTARRRVGVFSGVHGKCDGSAKGFRHFRSLALPSGLELLSHHPDIGRRK